MNSIKLAKIKVLFDDYAVGSNNGGNETYASIIYEKLKKISNLTIYPLSYFIRAPYGKNSKKLLRIIQLIIGIPLLIKREKIDLIHSQYFAPFFTTAKKIITVHDLGPYVCPKLFSLYINIVFNFALPISLKKCDAIVVPSEFTKNELSRYFPNINYKIKVINNGVDQYYKPLEKRFCVKIINAKYPNIKSRYIFTLNSKYKKKNINTVIKAFSKLSLLYPDIQLVIVGGSYNICEKFDKQKVIILDYVEKKYLLYLYNVCEVFIYYSFYEGFGLPPLEALSCCTRVIASDIPVHREVLKKFVYYADPYSYSDLENKLKYVISHPMEKNDKEELQNFIKKTYSWKQNTNKLYSLYLNTLQ